MLREGTEQSSQISQARRETCSHGVESSRARSAQNRTISITSELTRVRFVRRRQTSLGEDHFRVRKGEVLQQAGSAGPERHAASQLHSHLGKSQVDPEQYARFRGKPVSSELSYHTCGTNRNLQQENHSNFTVASPHSPNTMAPGRHHDIRCDLPPISGATFPPLQIPNPYGSQLVGRACVDQVVADFSPTRIQTRKPAWSTVTNPLRGNLVPVDHICCPTWQHFHFTTDLPQLTAFTSPFSRPGATRFSPHDRHAKPCPRSDWHGGRQTRIGRRVYCRCVQSVHGPNRAWGTGFVEILFTTQPSTISRGSIHGA